jgi:hypothetical protein
MRSFFSAALLIYAASAVAAGRFETLSPGLSVPAAAREEVNAVLLRAALVRDMPARRFATAPGVMDALFDHPVLTAEIARGMGLGDFYVEEGRGGAYRVREGSSIEAQFREIVRSGGLRLYHIEGQYYGSFFIHLSGEALLLAQYRPLGTHAVEVKADAALCVDNRFYGFLVSIFAPLFQRLVDRKFLFYMDVAKKLTESLARDPAGVYNRLVDRGLLSAENRELFAHLFIHPGGD